MYYNIYLINSIYQPKALAVFFLFLLGVLIEYAGF